jgi:hypothetical protein
MEQPVIERWCSKCGKALESSAHYISAQQGECCFVKFLNDSIGSACFEPDGSFGSTAAKA